MFGDSFDLQNQVAREIIRASHNVLLSQAMKTLGRKTIFRRILGCLPKEKSCNTKKVLYHITCKLRAVN